MDTEQIKQRIIALNEMLEKTDGMTDAFCLLDAETEEQAKLNWVNPHAVLVRQALIYRILRDCF